MNQKKYLAIIPARGGSKRLPRKNILELHGKPLISWTIEAALNSYYLDAVAVTSDDDTILGIAKKLGVLAIKRPEQLANDTATTFDVIKHAIETIDEHYEYVVLLQPTSPLRDAKHIDEAIRRLEVKKADAIVSVCMVDHSPLWMNTLPLNESMESFLTLESNKRSQDLPDYYRINGAIYICLTSKLLAEQTFFIAQNIFAYVMDATSSVDIDTEFDFKYADFLMRKA